MLLVTLRNACRCVVNLFKSFVLLLTYMYNSYIKELYILKKYLISRDWNNSPATFELIISNAITPLIERIKNKYIKLLHRIHHYCGSDYQWISWFIIWKYMYLKIWYRYAHACYCKRVFTIFFLKSTHRFSFLKKHYRLLWVRNIHCIFSEA